MDHTQKFDEAALAQKIRWEGGLWSALAYGITAHEIADPDLANLWGQLERRFREIAPLVAKAARRLDVPM